MSTDKTENQFFEEIKSGDRLTFQEYFYNNYTEMVRYALKITRNEISSEEIVQEVFIYLWEKKEKININSSLKSYLYAAIKNRCINYLKNELPKMQVHVDIDESNLSGEVEKIDPDNHQWIHDKVNKAIDELPQKCREIFLLSRTAGLTYEEIAEEMDISKKTVENQISIALKKLREALKPLITRYLKS